jgi:hypothetical protein
MQIWNVATIYFNILTVLCLALGLTPVPLSCVQNSKILSVHCLNNLYIWKLSWHALEKHSNCNTYRNMPKHILLFKMGNWQSEIAVMQKIIYIRRHIYMMIAIWRGNVCFAWQKQIIFGIDIQAMYRKNFRVLHAREGYGCQTQNIRRRRKK